MAASPFRGHAGVLDRKAQTPRTTASASQRDMCHSNGTGTKVIFQVQQSPESVTFCSTGHRAAPPLCSAWMWAHLTPSLPCPRVAPCHSATACGFPSARRQSHTNGTSLFATRFTSLSQPSFRLGLWLQGSHGGRLDRETRSAWIPWPLPFSQKQSTVTGCASSMAGLGKTQSRASGRRPSNVGVTARVTK